MDEIYCRWEEKKRETIWNGIINRSKRLWECVLRQHILSFIMLILRSTVLFLKYIRYTSISFEVLLRQNIQLFKLIKDFLIDREPTHNESILIIQLLIVLGDLFEFCDHFLDDFNHLGVLRKLVLYVNDRI